MADRQDPTPADEQPNPQLVEEIARRVVELLREEIQGAPRQLTDAATLARELGVERDWVYAHAVELGAVRLGGPRGRLRFDKDLVQERLGAQVPPRQARRKQGSGPRRAERVRPQRAPDRALKSPRRRRRAGGSAPARSPKRHRTGGNPE